MDAEYLKNLKELNEKAGEWYTVAEKGTVDICTRKPRRPAVVALMLSPEDAACIIAEHEAVPRLCDEVERLRGALEFYADREVWMVHTLVNADGQARNSEPIGEDRGKVARTALGVK